MTNFTAIADTLDQAATAMQRNPGLAPDGAVRLTVFGNPDATYPGDSQPGADLFNQATSAIQSTCGWQGNGIADIPHHEAIPAARAEAARYRSYGDGS